MNMLLVLNAGSSSIKFATYDSTTLRDEPRLLGKGHITQVDRQLKLQVSHVDMPIVEHTRAAKIAHEFDHIEALNLLFEWLDQTLAGRKLTAIGHRVVHGGTRYTEPVKVNEAVLEYLQTLIPLAPLHQPYSLQAIRIISQRWPKLTQVACFDTAFHHTQSTIAQAFALPEAITKAGVRRYGFHGLSYEYIATQLPEVLGVHANGKVIVAHLGNGASLCAMVAGKSVAATTGFSALDGLVMGTRCGSLDPGVVLYLLQQLKMSGTEISDLLYHQSGLLGVSGISSDMQVLLASEDPQAALAVDIFVYRIVTEIGALVAAMGGLDALVFTAGIGEHAAPIRARICSGCTWLGAHLDETSNSIDLELIHVPHSQLQLAVIPTDEESMIATHTLDTIVQGSAVHCET